MTSVGFTLGLSRRPEISARVATSSRGRFLRSLPTPPTTRAVGRRPQAWNISSRLPSPTQTPESRTGRPTLPGAPYHNECSTLKGLESAAHQEQHHNDDQDNSDDPDTTLGSPGVVGVITTAPAEQQQDHDDQQYQVHDYAPSLFEVTPAPTGASRSSFATLRSYSYSRI